MTTDKTENTYDKDFDHKAYLELNEMLNIHLVHWKNKINDNKCWDMRSGEGPTTTKYMYC